ncbi:molybdopterin-dependent oxidoreductase [Salinirubrum litoreum]|uniref:Molybdopterin-dependent oxidoreductase n=1 Tax=Salinirubrum litoreum TaxID=1126234 RepID=A0ABD5RBZ6_9EURY|nr:molybdopterin-dependent oxidoreductase [Salinirubrum litoreum]
MAHDTRRSTRTHRHPETGPRLTVVGDDRETVRLADFPTVDRDCTVVCASGDRTSATWTGVPVPELLDAVGAPPETTHLRVVADDGYAVCVEVRDALDALVALRRDGTRLADAEAYPTRFVGPSVPGERCVKGPVAVEAHALGARDDPEELEAVTLDDPQFG